MGAIVAFNQEKISEEIPLRNKNIISDNIAILGVGSVGSILAEELVRTKSVRNLTLIDFDIVNQHNLKNSAYKDCHVGMLKVEALKEKLEEKFSTGINIFTINSKYKNDIILNDFKYIDCRDEHCREGQKELIHKLYIRGHDSLIVDAREKEYKYIVNAKSNHSVCTDKNTIYKLIRAYISKVKTKSILFEVHNSIYSISYTNEKLQVGKELFLNDELNVEDSQEEITNVHVDKLVLSKNMNKFIQDYDENLSTLVVRDLKKPTDEFSIIPYTNDKTISSARLQYEINMLLGEFEDFFHQHKIASVCENNCLILFPDYPAC